MNILLVAFTCFSLITALDYSLDVKNSFESAYLAYLHLAFPNDELKPFSHSSQSMFNMPLSIIDSLDTLYIMELHHLHPPKTLIRPYITKFHPSNVSLFEFNIRVLGSLISMYDLTYDQYYLNQAVLIGERLLTAFRSSSSYFPFANFNLLTQTGSYHSWTNNKVVLSEIGTLSLELYALGDRSSDVRFSRVANDLLQKFNITSQNADRSTFQGNLVYNFVFPTLLDSEFLQTSSETFTLNGLADSYFEYIIKNFILLKGDPVYGTLSVSIITEIINNLISFSKEGYMFLGELNGSYLSGKQEHLACFFPATLLKFLITKDRYLPSLFDDTQLSNSLLIKTSISLTETCLRLYNQGLSPDGVSFEKDDQLEDVVLEKKFISFLSADNDNYIKSNKKQKTIAYSISDSRYLLRPEVIESVYFAWCYTKDEMYIEKAKKLWNSVKKLQLPNGAFTCLKEFNQELSESNIDDWQPSWFLAETLKYFFLLFKENDYYCKYYVFNTEAHPIKMFKYN
ncbi:hypothetical protein P9112_002515 [Eukaryota sp. TZLM1-RC]